MTEQVYLSDFDICPECGGEVYSRERCPDGVSWCEQGHAWRRGARLFKKRLADGRIHTTKVEYFSERVYARDR